jgi:hypothetical protein
MDTICIRLQDLMQKADELLGPVEMIYQPGGLLAQAS